jgi:hypothetical protein
MDRLSSTAVTHEKYCKLDNSAVVRTPSWAILFIYHLLLNRAASGGGLGECEGLLIQQITD